MIANSTKEEKNDELLKVEEEKSEKSRKRRKKKLRTRKFPIWLRIIVVLLLAVGCLVVGLMVGYGVIGDGNPTDALDKTTWQHIIDIVKKEK